MKKQQYNYYLAQVKKLQENISTLSSKRERLKCSPFFGYVQDFNICLPMTLDKLTLISKELTKVFRKNMSESIGFYEYFKELEIKSRTESFRFGKDIENIEQIEQIHRSIKTHIDQDKKILMEKLYETLCPVLYGTIDEISKSNIDSKIHKNIDRFNRAVGSNPIFGIGTLLEVSSIPVQERTDTPYYIINGVKQPTFFSTDSKYEPSSWEEVISTSKKTSGYSLTLLPRYKASIESTFGTKVVTGIVTDENIVCMDHGFRYVWLYLVRLMVTHENTTKEMILMFHPKLHKDVLKKFTTVLKYTSNKSKELSMIKM